MDKKLSKVLCERFCKNSFKCAACRGCDEDYQASCSNIDTTVTDVEDIHPIANPEQAAQLQQCAPDKCWECPSILC